MNKRLFFGIIIVILEIVAMAFIIKYSFGN